MTDAPERRLIINADDLGFSHGVNEAVFRAHRDGALTSASLCVNMPCAREAAEASRDHPELGVGIHLNVVRAGPVLPVQEVTRLVDYSGQFRHGLGGLVWARFLDRRRLFDEVRREYRAQIEQALSWGIRPTHLDSEKHHAAIPILFRLVTRLAREYRIPAVRVPREPFWIGAPKRDALALVRATVLRLLCRRADRRLRELRLSAPQWFYGGVHIGRISADLIRALVRALPAGTHELMTHPGMADPRAHPRARSYLDPLRESELQALLTPGLREEIEAAGVALCNYSVFRRE